MTTPTESLCQIITGAYNPYCHRNSTVTIESPIGRRLVTVSELKPGDLVAVKDPECDMELSELEDLLLKKSPGYQQDKTTVFEQNNAGVYVTRLRIMLLEGLLGEEATTYRAKIMGEEEDFTSEEYEGFVAQVKEKTGIELHNQTIKNWLSGETYAPHEWDNFEKLEKINPKFSEIHTSKNAAENEHADSGFFYHYKRMRGTILSARALLDGRVKEDTTIKKDGVVEKSTKLHFDYSEPRAALLEEVAELINNKIKFVKVQEVKTIPLPAEKSARTQYPTAVESDAIKRGILFGRTDELPSMSYNDILFEHNVLAAVLSETLEKVYHQENIESAILRKFQRTQQHDTMLDEKELDVVGLQTLNNRQYGEVRIIRDRGLTKVGTIAQLTARGILGAITKGKFDDRMLEEMNTILEKGYTKAITAIRQNKYATSLITNTSFDQLCQALYQLQDALPQEYRTENEINGSWILKDHKNMKSGNVAAKKRYETAVKVELRKHNATYKKVTQKYGITEERALLIDSVRYQHTHFSSEPDSPVPDDTTLVATWKEKGILLFSFEDAERILRKYEINNTPLLVRNVMPRDMTLCKYLGI